MSRVLNHHRLALTGLTGLMVLLKGTELTAKGDFISSDKSVVRQCSLNFKQSTK